MARKVSDQATLQKQAEQEAGILLTFLPFTKKTSSSPAWLGAILHTFPTSLQQGHRAALWEQPYSPEQSEHQPHHRWPESASTTFDLIFTPVPCESPYYIRGAGEACQLPVVGAPAALMTAEELGAAEWPAPFYIAEDHNSAAFPSDDPARLGALLGATSKEFTAVLQCSANFRGGRGRSPSYPSPNIDKKKLFPLFCAQPSTWHSPHRGLQWQHLLI